jgi:hypothetical protein
MAARSIGSRGPSRLRGEAKGALTPKLRVEGGAVGVDNDFIERGVTGIGATIIGRNMFGPIRRPWDNDEWKGWWGDNPPY